MATQLQRAYGIASGKEAVPAPAPKSAGKKEARPEKRGGDKGDPYPGLPRRPLGIEKEG